MKNIIWGIVLVIVGIFIGLYSLDIIDFNIFFSGWWTLFIIIPSLINLFQDEDKTGSIIGLFIGIFLLLGMQNVIDFSVIWKLLLPTILVILGLSLVFKNSFDKQISKTIQEKNKDFKDNEYCATFSEQKLDFDNEKFTGATLNAIFGGIKLDLRKAKIKEDVLIDATSIFGGITLYLPKDIKVKVKQNAIFGGVSGIKKNNLDDSTITIYVSATCLFGGIELK